MTSKGTVLSKPVVVELSRNRSPNISSKAFVCIGGGQKVTKKSKSKKSGIDCMYVDHRTLQPASSGSLSSSPQHSNGLLISHSNSKLRTSETNANYATLTEPSKLRKASSPLQSHPSHNHPHLHAQQQLLHTTPSTKVQESLAQNHGSQLQNIQQLYTKRPLIDRGEYFPSASSQHQQLQQSQLATTQAQNVQRSPVRSSKPTTPGSNGVRSHAYNAGSSAISDRQNSPTKQSPSASNSAVLNAVTPTTINSQTNRSFNNSSSPQGIAATTTTSSERSNNTQNNNPIKSQSPITSAFMNPQRKLLSASAATLTSSIARTPRTTRFGSPVRSPMHLQTATTAATTPSASLNQSRINDHQTSSSPQQAHSPSLTTNTHGLTKEHRSISSTTTSQSNAKRQSPSGSPNQLMNNNLRSSGENQLHGTPQSLFSSAAYSPNAAGLTMPSPIPSQEVQNIKTSKKFQDSLKQIRESYDISSQLKRIPIQPLLNHNHNSFGNGSGSPMSPNSPSSQLSFLNKSNDTLFKPISDHFLQTTAQNSSSSDKEKQGEFENNSSSKEKAASISAVLKTRAGAHNRFYRKQNQDTGLFLPKFLGCRHTCLYGVYDGHGENGTQASQYIKKQIIKHITNEINAFGGIESDSIDFVECLRRAYTSASRDILMQNEFDISFSGCTAVTLILHKCMLYVANAGDSRAVYFRNQLLHPTEDIMQLSIDHKPELASEAARINSSGGRVDQVRNVFGEPVGIYRVWKRDQEYPGLAMTRSMGDGVARECGVISEPEIQTFELGRERQQFFVIASDGVWDQLSNLEVGKLVLPYLNGNRISDAADKLISVSNMLWQKQGESVDDITCVLVFINGFKDIIRN